MRYVEGAKKVFLNTGTSFPPKVVWSVALIKREAAKANSSLGLLDPKTAAAIAKASQQVMGGKNGKPVSVDVFQTGSGTGLNMDLNELIAEKASELLGKKVHPNDHVNMGQSSNDVVPSAIRIAAVALCAEELSPAMKKASQSLVALSRKTSAVYKAGRTHMRDALPVTMGQEFGAYAAAFDHDAELLRAVMSYVKELPIGGTAVGTGLNADPKFGSMVAQAIAESGAFAAQFVGGLVVLKIFAAQLRDVHQALDVQLVEHHEEPEGHHRADGAREDLANALAHVVALEPGLDIAGRLVRAPLVGRAQHSQLLPAGDRRHLLVRAAGKPGHVKAPSCSVASCDASTAPPRARKAASPTP
jgi:aspartate ammonia-lyase